MPGWVATLFKFLVVRRNIRLAIVIEGTVKEFRSIIALGKDIL